MTRRIPRYTYILVPFLLLGACTARNNFTEMLEAYESHKAESIERLLEARVGPGAVRATISARLDKAGAVNRVSVAVLVDHAHGQGANGEVTATPRTLEEMEAISNLVRAAIGFDETRGDNVEILNVRFFETIKVK